MINHFKRYSACVLVAGILLTSCDSDEALISGEGELMMRTILSSDDTTLNNTLADSCNIYIYNDKGIIRKYKGIENLPETIWLKSGIYRVEAWSGDSLPASFDAKFYKGSQEFDIKSGSTTTIDLNCTIANIVTSVKYDNEVTDALSDYSVTVSHTRGSLKFEGNDSRKGYFMMPNGVKQLNWTLSATTFDGKPFSKKGVITNVKPGVEYCINIKYSGNLPEQGSALIMVVVDETEIDVNHDVAIHNAPTITGIDFDITQPLICDSGMVERKALVITSPAELSQVTMSCDSLVGLGFDSQSYNLLPISDTMSDYLLHKGINYLYRSYNDGSSNFVLNLSAKLCNALPSGEYPIKIEATDINGLKREATFILIVNAVASEK